MEGMFRGALERSNVPSGRANTLCQAIRVTDPLIRRSECLRLLNAGADPNESVAEQPTDATMDVMYIGTTPFLELLHGATQSTADAELVHLFLDHGADHKAILDESAQHECDNVDQCLTDAMTLAVRSQNAGIVRRLIAAGANVNGIAKHEHNMVWEIARTTKPALYLACELGNLDVIRELLQAGAKPDSAKESTKETRDDSGNLLTSSVVSETVLDLASRNNNEAMVKLLIEFGAQKQ